MNCEFCNNQFSTLSALNNHKNTAKYCLIIQNKDPKSNFKCRYCDKKFTSKYGMSNHQNNCKESYILVEPLKNENMLLKQRLEDKEKQFQDTIGKYENQIKELQNQLSNIAHTAALKPTHVQNNQKINTVINNLIPITDDHLKEQAQFLTLDHIKNGPSGYAKYALDYPLKDRITCPDFSRRKINYKDSEGNLVTDPEMKKLCGKLFKSIEEQNSILSKEYINELQDRMTELNSNSSNNMDIDETTEFQKKWEEILSFLVKCQDQMFEVKKVAKGENSNIINDFVKDVCAKVTL